MKIVEHADRTEKLYGIRAEDIHKWLDGFFDRDGFDLMLRRGRDATFDPYDHRKFRHCQESIEEAYAEFGDSYSREQIRNVVECHIRDDYDNYLPKRADFENGTFTEKYHHSTQWAESETILSTDELCDYFNGHSQSYKKKSSKLITSFGLRIILPTIISILLFVAAMLFIILPFFEDSMLEQKKLSIKELTQSAISIIYEQMAQVKSGHISPLEAKKNAADIISKLRYGESNLDYFFIIDTQPIMIMHPYRPDLIGKDLSTYRDSENKSGINLFKHFVELTASDGEGYLRYQWQWMDQAGKSATKISYVKAVPEWDWIIGTGVYIEDIKAEIERIDATFFKVFAGISVCLVALMLFIILQSHKIENNRLRAETGLHEAKNRYRALVEASNEGYILEADGETLYSNTILQKMLGHDEEEFKNNLIWGTIFGGDANSALREHLSALFANAVDPAEFEAQARTSEGKIIDLNVSSSRIFFSSRHGHVITFRPIRRHHNFEMKNSLNNLIDYRGVESEISDEISASTNLPHVVSTLNRLPELINKMLGTGAKAEALRRVTGTAYDSAIKKIIELSLAELGEPPSPFAFISLGSNARHEMTMFSDQDNAIVFENPADNDPDRVRRYFLKLAESVCGKLHQAGFKYCPGGIMANNAKWCLSQREWQHNLEKWVGDADSEALLELNVFFDMHCAYGKRELVSELQDSLQALVNSKPSFFLHYARNGLHYRPQLTLFGKLRAQDHDGIKTISLKEALRPINTFSRLYALKHGITESNTLLRFEKLRDKEEINNDMFNEMIYVFNYIWELRFLTQINKHNELRKIDDNLDIDHLSDIERQNLKNVLAKISLFQNKISFDFFGSQNV